jgi:hypothetical protein
MPERTREKMGGARAGARVPDDARPVLVSAARG